MYEINELLKTAVQNNASDIFLTVGVPPMVKIDNRILPMGEAKILAEDSKMLIFRLFPNEEKFALFMQNKCCDFSYSISGVGRFRVSTFFQRGSVAATIRIVRFHLPDPEKLGIPQAVLDAYKYKSGLVLVTGPSGSGKSTTLAAIINLINENRHGHILTIEDPIEYLHPHKNCIVNQREVNMDCISYADALRVSLRQAPDVIFIGEMRDLETISAAVTAAETGHFVLSTLHTRGAANSIDRIVDVFPPNQQQQIRIQLASVLKLVVSQQLVMNVSGCLTAAFEIMTVNSAIRNLIREGRTHQINMMIQSGQKEGMQTMTSCLKNMYQGGIISRDMLTEAGFEGEIDLDE
ncbi:MAG: type IV pilus twitching motility protein PilT [Clostridia bacterium]|nr:type IV pilus twitching motility protein PilT [Clostridia bacterium]MDR3645517.1 type IV pilus twitching motility protein PilT [Clostridia bacterium]